MIRFIDFALLGAALYMAQMWHDGNAVHMWVMTFAVFATNIVGFIRGTKAGRY